MHQAGVLGPAFGQQVAHAVQHGRRGREIGSFRVASGAHKGGGLGQRVQAGVGKQAIGQRLQPGFTRNHALGAALGLVRQVQVFQFLLGGSGFEGGTQGRRELALLFNALDDRFAPLLQLAQVGQARFKLAQLDVIQPIGHFLAVAGDEGHGGTAVEQLDRGAHLLFGDLDFGSNLPEDFLHGRFR